MTTRLYRIAPLLLVPLLAGACATKRDVRMLSTEVAGMRMHQDSVLRNMQRQNRMLLDSIRAAMQISLNTGGTTATRLREFDQTVDRLTQLMGQVTNGMSRIEQRLTTMENRLSTLEQRPQPQAQGMSPDQLFATGLQHLSDGSWARARIAFETLVQQYPNDERAPQAQIRIGETFAGEEAWNEAYAAFEVVPQRWSGTAAARQAILQAGITAQEKQRDRAKARTYYERLVRDHRNTDEARDAQRRLNSIGR